MASIYIPHTSFILILHPINKPKAVAEEVKLVEQNNKVRMIIVYLTLRTTCSCTHCLPKWYIELVVYTFVIDVY